MSAQMDIMYFISAILALYRTLLLGLCYGNLPGLCHYTFKIYDLPYATLRLRQLFLFCVLDFVLGFHLLLMKNLWFSYYSDVYKSSRKQQWIVS